MISRILDPMIQYLVKKIEITAHHYPYSPFLLNSTSLCKKWQRLLGVSEFSVVGQSLGWIRPPKSFFLLHHHLMWTNFSNGIKMSQSALEMLLSIVHSLSWGASKVWKMEALPANFVPKINKTKYFATNHISHIFYECILGCYGAFVMNEWYFLICVTYMTEHQFVTGGHDNFSNFLS
jgi:hypothetical protein